MRDEAYILDLCDELLRAKSCRQHRFHFLRGDRGHRLPVDAFYPNLRLVIEYRERQHTEFVPFFDKRTTVSGVSRGAQRALYDERRRVELGRNGLLLVELNVTEFPHTSRRRLQRVRAQDVAVIQARLAQVVRGLTLRSRADAPPAGGAPLS